jgi:diamine N-acetyltransferase
LNWTIRDATADDAGRLADFGARTFLDTFGHLYPDADKEAFLAERFSLARTLKDIGEPGRSVRLVFVEEALVGYLDCGPFGLPLAEVEPGSLEVYRIYLDQSQFGTGLAKYLMGLAIDWAKAAQAPALYLGVFHANHRALAFYRKFGFEIVGAYHFKVGQTLDDERIMRLGLKA